MHSILSHGQLAVDAYVIRPVLLHDQTICVRSLHHNCPKRLKLSLITTEALYIKFHSLIPCRGFTGTLNNDYATSNLRWRTDHPFSRSPQRFQ